MTNAPQMAGETLGMPLAAGEHALEFPSAEYINITGLFTDEKDRFTALNTADRLAARLAGGHISEATYFGAMHALMSIVPTYAGERDGRPARSIDGKTLNKNQEALIDSRLKAEEVDIAGPEGSWGRLPFIVKRQVTSVGREIKMELSTGCTLACRYCSFAKVKGPVQQKASFDSAVEVIDYFVSNQRKPHYKRPITDCLYWGSDPFDLKWAGEGDDVLDYSDLAEYHEAVSAGRNRRLFTSTSIPIGEELKVLGFADYVLSSPERRRHHGLRLSLNDVNKSRYLHIIKVISALYPDFANEIKTNDVMEHVAKRGKALERADSFSLWDITGPNCRDGVLIGVKSADALIMQGASEEQPDGELRFPIEEKTGDDWVFTIPQQYKSPRLEGHEHPNAIYPIVRTVEITVHPDGSSEVKNKIRTNDPHRALLRVAGGILHLQARAGKGLIGRPMAARQFRTYFGGARRDVQEYIDRGGKNKVMEQILGQLSQIHILDIE